MSFTIFDHCMTHFHFILSEFGYSPETEFFQEKIEQYRDCLLSCGFRDSGSLRSLKNLINDEANRQEDDFAYQTNLAQRLRNSQKKQNQKKLATKKDQDQNNDDDDDDVNDENDEDDVRYNSKDETGAYLTTKYHWKTFEKK